MENIKRIRKKSLNLAVGNFYNFKNIEFYLKHQQVKILENELLDQNEIFNKNGSLKKSFNLKKYIALRFYVFEILYKNITALGIDYKHFYHLNCGTKINTHNRKIQKMYFAIKDQKKYEKLISKDFIERKIKKDQVLKKRQEKMVLFLKLFTSFLKKNEIDYVKTNSNSTNSSYIETDLRTYRFSDHAKGKSHWRWNDYEQEKEYIDNDDILYINSKKKLAEAKDYELKNILTSKARVREREMEMMAETLFKAIEKNDSVLIKKMLDAGADANARNELERTALIMATRHGYLKIAQLLINAGADVNARDEYKRTALHYAEKKGHKNIVELLIKHGANR